MEKIRKIVKYENLSEEVLEAFNEKYPEGFKNIIFKVDAPKGAFYAFTFEHENVSYLVKVDVSIDNIFDEVEDDDDAIEGGEDTFIAAAEELEEEDDE
ncbi:MAG TPA: hypothetical protein DDX39_08945 [Bacteroidales bacterium]|nr:MAG: hypothetical protein A2W98_06250 [Bacteroidetes bacterium GWF2_33_38]OFY85964.1 MAG: hypothetical protein A2236_00755 [Bacteroidetes bacterium RIFOXYA2_FULL_33_7]HBF88754.1 hypothetical protein [Bacteroidales bacterium]